MESQIHKPSRPLTRDELLVEQALLGARIDQLEIALRQEVHDREMADLERDIVIRKLEERPRDESHWIFALNGQMVHVQFWGPGIRMAAKTAVKAEDIREQLVTALQTATAQRALRPHAAA